MLRLKSEVKYEGKMDKEVVALCDAINALPALHTIESCCGHGEDVFSIWFKCDGTSMDGLFFLTRCVDRRYFQHGHSWSIELEVGDLIQDGILPTYFLLQSGNLWSGDKIMGEEAYKQAEHLVENMNQHLNHENFMNGFGLKVEDFNTEKIEE